MRKSTLLAWALAAWSAFPAAAGQDSGARLIIGFKQDVQGAKKAQALERLGMEPVESLDAINAVVVEAPEGKAAAAKLAGHPDIYHVEEDFYANWLRDAAGSFQQAPLPSLPVVMRDLPRFAQKDASDGEVPWGVARVNAREAWGRTQGAGVKVAVVDTGVDYTHPDLAANYKGGYNALDSDAPPMDDHGHGTHVAGTLAAVQDGQGVVGVAPRADLYAVKVLDSRGGGRLTSIIKGMIWCGNNGIQVANMSLGSPTGSLFMRMSLAYAKSRGVVIVAAAGNSGGSVGYPAAYSEAIAVAASDADDRIAGFSSRGRQVEFIAPGVNVNSTLPGGKYGRFSGTSMATPHVAGLAALAVAQGARDVHEVRQVLQRASAPLDGLEGEEQGHGMIDAGDIRPPER